MIPILLFFALLCTSASEARWLFKKEKVILPEILDNILTDAKKYIAEQQLDFVPLPDFFHEGKDYSFSIDNCQFGKFSSLELELVNSFQESKASDGKVYSFNLTLGLYPLLVRCDYQLVLTGRPTKGMVEFSTMMNSFNVFGKVETGSGYCQAELLSSKGYDIQDFKFSTDEASSPELVKKYIVDFMSPHLLNIINTALDGFGWSPRFRTKFEDIICHVIPK